MAQSLVTGGWGPDEMLAPGSDDLYQRLTKTHNSFETPCGAYAHFKITRYLLRVTLDSCYGDSMERTMYNTVLGARPMHADVRAFYYQDCNFLGKKVYSNHRFPCCSGYPPAVAADYRINCYYFHDERGIFVNLYIPSSVQWGCDNVMISIKQQGDYPFEDTVHFELAISRTKKFTPNFRIPEWAEHARIQVNGKSWPEVLVPGTFVSVLRRWGNGDRVVLELPPKMGLQAIDPTHSDVVALLCGPLVLFPITAKSSQPAIRRAQLLAARQIERQLWETGSDSSEFKPYIAIDGERY